MILITGATGFVGHVLIRQLVTMDKPVRILLRPSLKSPNIPLGIAVEAVVCSLQDERSLRAAMKGVQVVYHLVGSERVGSRADLEGVDIDGTQAVVKAAVEAGVGRFIYLSHLGADRFSAFPLLKTKAIAEGRVIHSGIDYVIVRSAPIFGPGDQFFVSLARLLKLSPLFFLLPGDGGSLIQPIWVEDVAVCLSWAAEESQPANQIYTIGGSDYLTFRQVIELLMKTLNIRRFLIQTSPAYLRIITLWVEQFYPRLPVASFMLDYLAVDRTAPLDTVPRQFGLIPARLYEKIDYIKDEIR